MDKEIRIFDTSNKVLKVSGIKFELFEVGTGRLLSNDTSRDLNPPHDEWGVKLTFSSSSGPFQVYTNDPSYRYPGNVIENLEGANSNRIDIDLEAVPVHGSGQQSPPDTADVVDVLNWIQAAPNWSGQEKRAVRRLFLNFVKLLADTGGKPEKTKLAEVADNWATALHKLQIPFARLGQLGGGGATV
jgi:hypothetical protein